MPHQTHQPTDLVFVRHGETVWNSQGRWQGWGNTDLTDTGVAQARAAGEELSQTAFAAAYASVSGRAVQTARIILEGRGIAVVEDEDLRERFYGAYEGLNAREISEQLPGTRFTAGRDTREEWRPPGGETMAEVRARLSRFLARALAAHAGQTVLVVTHSGIVRAMDSIARDESFDEIWNRVPPNACIFVVRALPGGKWEILRDFAAGSAAPTPQPNAVM